MQSNSNELATKATTRSAAAATSKEPNANPTPPSPPNQTISTPKTNKQTTPLPPSPKAHSVTQPPVLPPSPHINHIPTAVILSPPTQDIQEINSSSSEDEEVKADDQNFPTDLSDIDVESNGESGFTTHYFSGTFPTPNGKVAKLFASLPQAIQLDQTETLININPANKPIVTIGNDYSSVLQPFLIAIPGNKRKVRVIYGVVKAENHPIFQASPIANDLIALHGEYTPGVKLPYPLILPTQFITGRVVRVPEGPEFSQKRTDPSNSKMTWFKANQVKQGFQLPTIIPIPAFLVYDAFDHDMDAIVIYERWMSMRDQLDTSYPNTDLLLRSFLKAQSVSVTKKHPQSQVDIHIFLDNPPPVAEEWVNQAIALLFPATANDSTEPPTTKSPSPTQPTIHQPPRLSSTINNQHQHLTQPNTTSQPSPTLHSQPSSPTTIATLHQQRIQPKPTTSIPPYHPTPSIIPNLSIPTIHMQTPIHNLNPIQPPPTPQIAAVQTPSAMAPAPTYPSPYQHPLPALPPGFTMEHMVALMATSIRAANQGISHQFQNPTQTNSTSTSISTPTGPPEFLGTCEDTHIRLITMCGLPKNATLDLLPYVWHRLAKNKGDLQQKKSTVRSEIRDNCLHNDARVVPIAPILIMVIKRDFEEEIIGSCRKTAAKGLTIFSVPTMSQAAVNKINDHYDSLATATQITVKEVTSASFEAVAPHTYQELTRVIKRFSNLLFALFGKQCPLLIEMEKLIEELQEYSEQAIASMSIRTLVSIAWIIHLQSRHFTQGKMIPPTLFIPEFENMKIQISTKQQVVHGDVPTEMYEQHPPSNLPVVSYGSKRKQQVETIINPPEAKKKAKLFNIPNYHPKIRDSMKVLASQPKLPRIKAICEVCNITQNDIFPKRKNLCIKSALFGTCFDTCQFKHETITDEEAAKAIITLKPAIDHPEKVKQTR